MKKAMNVKKMVCVLMILAICLCGCNQLVPSDGSTENEGHTKPYFGDYTVGTDSTTEEESATNSTEGLTEDSTETPEDTTSGEATTEPENTEESTENLFTGVEDTVYVLASLNVRAKPSLDGEIIGGLKAGDSVHRTGIGDEWMRIDYYGHTAYVYGEYVSETKPTEPETVVPPTAVEGTGILYDNGGYLIAIDPGHQGKGNSEKEPVGPGATELKAKVSSGTQGVSTGIAEHVLNLAVSLYLRDELLARGYSVLMIRETANVDISNAERAELANSYHADAFIRVHANSHSNSEARGALTMCMTPNNPYNKELYDTSRRLSELVLDGMCAATGAARKSIIETDTMSGINWCRIPVTIVEMGFMSNAAEDEAMAKDSYRRAMATGIADGIDAYFSR